MEKLGMSFEQYQIYFPRKKGKGCELPSVIRFQSFFFEDFLKPKI